VSTHSKEDLLYILIVFFSLALGIESRASVLPLSHTPIVSLSFIYFSDYRWVNLLN
jgi:hypothetical protein